MKRFADPETWNDGGSHGLTLRYRKPTPAGLLAARDALWTFPGLEGCWRRCDREPSPASRIATTWGLDPEKMLHGVAAIPGTEGVACCAIAHPPSDHEEDCPLCRDLGLHDDTKEGWLSLYLPFGALRAVLPIGAYPEEDGSSLAWRDVVDGWLRELAAHVFRAAPFDLGLVGWTDGGVDGLPESVDEVPEDRSIGYLLPAPSGVEPSGLAWFPTTRGAPLPAWED